MIKYYILQLPTSFGKTLQAIKLLDEFRANKILIVCPKLVLFQTWKDEFAKWDKREYLTKVTFTSYASIHKYLFEDYDTIILDECHHVTERVYNVLQAMHKEHVICLSATIKKETKQMLDTLLPNNKFITVSVKDAISMNRLPSPKILLYPLSMPQTEQKYVYIKNTKGKVKVKCTYEERWKYLKDKNNKVSIYCTAIQYLAMLNHEIDYFKNRYMQGRANYIKNCWLRLCLERLKFLSTLKEPITFEIQKAVNKYRTITFCSDIAQTERMGKNAINSKVDDSSVILSNFNAGKINHITTCQMCNEGINLVDCKIGIWAYLNASEVMTIQKLGRILRHKEPIAILPYFLSTREQELAQDFIKNCDEKNVQIVTNINQLKEIIND